MKFKTSLLLFVFVGICLSSCTKKRTVYTKKRTNSSHSNTRPKPTKTNSSSHSSKVANISSTAKKQIGSRYKYGGIKPNGFDCSGLVHYVYGQAGCQLPRISSEQAKRGKDVSKRTTQKGDLVFFGTGRRVTHVGIVVGNKNGWPIMIHSSSSKGVIQTELYNSDYWKHRYLYARRVL